MLAKNVPPEKNDLHMLALLVDLQKNMLLMRAKHVLPKENTLYMSVKGVFLFSRSFFIKVYQKNPQKKQNLIGSA
ncbi:hypothetical protein BXY64_3503 [Marinifilum flexuosum]|uniref:Uncharacterized protein n=1 Tax=Marinifilum flexuosum TaxID=1117708 RepID=A0A419WT46_9BACT|nr:hypothetical protein BXY64_3503 [Marinifilum flexuosum]